MGLEELCFDDIFTGCLSCDLQQATPFPYAFSFIFPEMEVAGPGLLQRAERRQAGPLVQLTKQASTALVAAENQRDMRIKERSG